MEALRFFWRILPKNALKPDWNLVFEILRKAIETLQILSRSNITAFDGTANLWCNAPKLT